MSISSAGITRSSHVATFSIMGASASRFVDADNHGSRLEQLAGRLLRSSDDVRLVDGSHDAPRHQDLAIDDRRLHIAPPAAVDEVPDDGLRIKRSCVGAFQRYDREIRTLPDLDRTDVPFDM